MKKLLEKIKTIPCAITFIVFLVVGILLTYKTLFYGWYTILGIVFVIVFATTITCMTKNTKEKVIQAKKYKKSLLGIVGVVIGVGALQVCGVNAFMCGSTIGLSFLGLILPASAINIMSTYSIHIIILSIATQIVGLYYMKCFR